MEEINGQVGNGCFVVADMENTGGRERRHGRCLNLVKLSELFERGLVFGPYGDGHPLLALRDEDFPRREPCLLERNFRKINFAPVRVFSHLADGGGESPCTVVRNARNQASISSLKHHIKHFLLGDGVADLNGA